MNPIVSNGNKFEWEFENVNELADKGTFSDTLTFKNIDWKIEARTVTVNSIEYLSVYLWYDGDNKAEKNWICETKRIFRILDQDENENGEDLTSNCVSIYSASGLSWGSEEFLEWSKLESGGYMKNNSIILKIELDFKYYDFSKNIPNYTDVILNVDDTKFYVNKGLLCSKSEYFYNKFVVNNSDEEELTIENVEIEDFRYFIASFCFFFEVVNDHNYEQLIKLADEYKTPGLHRNCEKYLISKESLSAEKKIGFADRYSYSELLKKSINSFTTIAQIKEMRKTIEFKKFKDTTKLAIMTHLLNIV